MAPDSKRPVTRWMAWAALLGSATALLLGLARLFGWLSRVQIDYLAN